MFQNVLQKQKIAFFGEKYQIYRMKDVFYCLKQMSKSLINTISDIISEKRDIHLVFHPTAD